jgi:hypothetical protein
LYAKFEVATQVILDLIWKYIQIGFELEFILKQGLHGRNIVDIVWGYCISIVATIVPLGVSHPTLGYYAPTA